MLYHHVIVVFVCEMVCPNQDIELLIQACSDSHDALANAELLEMLTALFLYKTTQVQYFPTGVSLDHMTFLLILLWLTIAIVFVVTNVLLTQVMPILTVLGGPLLFVAPLVQTRHEVERVR
jgi:hypothetical protein